MHKKYTNHYNSWQFLFIHIITGELLIRKFILHLKVKYTKYYRIISIYVLLHTYIIANVIDADYLD